LIGAVGLVFGSIITPAIVASIVTFYFNLRAEKRRAERDFVTKTFDGAREDVRRAIEAAAEYLSLPSGERNPSVEAKIIIAERDVRHSVETLIAFSNPQSGGCKPLEAALDDFIDALTGGTFGSASCAADLPQVRKVASTGARLRSAISTARQLELKEAVDADVLARSTRAALAYAREDQGPLMDMEQSSLPMSLPTSTRPSAGEK